MSSSLTSKIFSKRAFFWIFNWWLSKIWACFTLVFTNSTDYAIFLTSSEKKIVVFNTSALSNTCRSISIGVIIGQVSFLVKQHFYLQFMMSHPFKAALSSVGFGFFLPPGGPKIHSTGLTEQVQTVQKPTFSPTILRLTKTSVKGCCRYTVAQ